MASETHLRKRQRTSETDEYKKQRGRPRVDGQDETAADVCGFLSIADLVPLPRDPHAPVVWLGPASTHS